MAYINGNEILFSAEFPQVDMAELNIVQKTGDSTTKAMSQKAVTELIGDYFNIKFANGFYANNSNNSIFPHDQFSYAEFEVKDATIIKVPNLTERADFQFVQFLNGNNFISGLKTNATSGDVVLEIPKGCTTMRVNLLTSRAADFYALASVFSVVESTKEGLLVDKMPIYANEWGEGYLNTNGSVIAHSDYRTSNFVLVFPYTKISVYSGVKHNSIAWCGYDENKNLIKTYVNDVEIGKNRDIDTSGVHYIRFTYSASQIANFRAYGYIDETISQNLHNIILKIANTDKPEDRPYPVTNMPESGGYMAIFDRIGVIGDSLASGEMAYNNSTGEFTQYYVDMYNFSWIQYIGRICGSTAFNFSRGGLSTRTFLNNTGEQLNKMLAPENKCKCYFIALGHNDKNQSVPIGTASDIDLTNYNNNADTYYGNYAKIIQKIKEIEPNAVIFPITMKPTTFETGGWNTVVRYMENIFDNVYVLDMYRYFPEIPDWHYTEGHGNIMGYLWYAKELTCYVDWIVRNNPNKFKYVQFIGTEYANYIPTN